MKGLVVLNHLLVTSLIGLTAVRQFYLEPLAHPGPNVVWFLLQVAPLAALVPGLMRGGRRSFLLVALASMLYFIHGVLETVDAPLRWYGMIEALLAAALAITASYVVRQIPQAV